MLTILETSVNILSRVEMLVTVIIAGPESIFMDQWSLYFRINLFYIKQRTEGGGGELSVFKIKPQQHIRCYAMISLVSR